jgi:hypothetical protein
MEPTIIHTPPSSCFDAQVSPVLYVDEDRAMFGLIVQTAEGVEGYEPVPLEKAAADPDTVPIAMSYDAAVALAEQIIETADHAMTTYFSLVEVSASSNISEVRYQSGRSVLRVTFKDGATYDYYGVPVDVVVAWREAESAGKYFNSTIKAHPDRYPFFKREPEGESND